MHVGLQNAPQGRLEINGEAALNYPDQLDAHILETTTGKINVVYLL